VREFGFFSRQRIGGKVSVKFRDYFTNQHRRVKPHPREEVSLESPIFRRRGIAWDLVIKGRVAGIRFCTR
jgi:hypothetical protein